MTIRRFLFLFIGVALSLSIEAFGNHEALLKELDKVIPMREQYASERRFKIDSLLKILPTLDNNADRYNLYRSIYGAYRSYRNDSALSTAERRLQVARAIGDRHKITSASLNMADGFSACGNYSEALTILDSLNRVGMEPHHLKYLYSVYGQTFRRMGRADLLDSRKLDFKKKEKAYRDSALAMLSDTEADYHYLKSFQLMDAGHWNEALKLMEQTEKRFGPIDENASLLAQKALIYHNLGNADLEKEYLTRAAIIDLQSGIKDYSALMDLAIHLNEEGDVERAYEYIRAALDDALFSNAKSRTSEILQAVPIIDAAYAQSEREQRHLVWALFGVAGLLAVGLALALWFVRGQLSKNKKARDRLADANTTRAEHINELFDEYSSYIDRISVFRKRAAMLLKVGKYGEAKDFVESDKIESDELKELYQRFDKMFLSMHPDFIREYNSMVKPEARIEESADTLTSALRVLALMKIGITSTKRIASMLHYTQQTVYNYRNRTRAALAVDKSVFDRWLGVDASLINS